MSRLRQRVLPELRSQETLAQTPRRPLSAAPVCSGRATGLRSRTDGPTAFATAAAERPPRPWHVHATVPVGPGWISKKRNHVKRFAAPLLIPNGSWLGEAIVRRANYIYRVQYLYLCVISPNTIIIYNNILLLYYIMVTYFSYNISTLYFCPGTR